MYVRVRYAVRGWFNGHRRKIDRILYYWVFFAQAVRISTDVEAKVATTCPNRQMRLYTFEIRRRSVFCNLGDWKKRTKRKYLCRHVDRMRRAMALSNNFLVQTENFGINKQYISMPAAIVIYSLLPCCLFLTSSKYTCEAPNHEIYRIIYLIFCFVFFFFVQNLVFHLYGSYRALVWQLVHFTIYMRSNVRHFKSP